MQFISTIDHSKLSLPSEQTVISIFYIKKKVSTKNRNNRLDGFKAISYFNWIHWGWTSRIVKTSAFSMLQGILSLLLLL